MASREITVRTTTADDWARYRGIRLAMLEESPQAFAEPLSRARRRTERAWRRRVGPSPRKAITVAAIASQRWVGTATCYLDRDSAILVAVYVVPEFRGSDRGVLDALLASIERWARERVTSLTLIVGEDNLRAQRAYDKRGYRHTGRTVRHPWSRRRHEIEMAKHLPHT